MESNYKKIFKSAPNLLAITLPPPFGNLPKYKAPKKSAPKQFGQGLNSPPLPGNARI